MSTRHADIRRNELAQIHIAKQQLGLDEATYRDMLWSIARVRSAADLDFTGRKRVLEHLRARGFHGKPGAARNPEWGWVDRAAADRRPMLRKIIMLLKSAGRGRAYVDGDGKTPGMCMRICGVERLEFCTPEQLHKLVAALAKDQARHHDRERA